MPNTTAATSVPDDGTATRRPSPPKDTRHPVAAARPRTLDERRRRPTGLPSNPIILLSGPELTGKTTRMVHLTADPRISHSYIVQLGEVDGDPYGAMRDRHGRAVDYELFEHDGTWDDIILTLQQINEDARKVAVRYPDRAPMLGFDSATAEWAMLKDWGEERTRRSPKVRQTLQDDPAADVKISSGMWTPINERHRDWLKLMLEFPGVVVLTCRGKMVHQVDGQGNPIAEKTKPKLYTLETQKDLGFSVGCWVRVERDDPPTIINARYPRGPQAVPIIPGETPPLQIAKDFDLPWLVFDFIGFDPRESELRRRNAPVVGAELSAGELADRVELPDGNGGVSRGVSRLAWGFKTEIERCAALGEMSEIFTRIRAALNRRELLDREGQWLRGIFDGHGETLKAASAPAAAEGEDRHPSDPDPDDPDLNGEVIPPGFPVPQGEQALRDVGL